MMPLAVIVQAAVAAAPVAAPQAAIETEMAASAAGWNAGALDRFMAVYADDAVYAAGKELARGKAEIARRYAKSFADGANTRGTLSFQPVAWRTISNVHMLPASASTSTCCWWRAGR